MNGRRSLPIVLVLFCGAAISGEWNLYTAARQDRWREWDTRGAALLEERGTLMAVGAQGATQWHGLAVDLRVEGVGGTRRYRGQTNRGTPLSTDVDVRQGSAAFALGWPIDAAWQWRVALQPTWLSRDLHDTLAAAGYTERWRWTRGALGVRWLRPFGTGAFTLEAEAAAALDARLQLTLPGRDEATLRPRHGRGWRAGVGWQAPLSAEWQWSAGLARERLRFDASDAVALTRGGVLQGGLMQPRTQLDTSVLRCGVERRW